MPTEGEFVVPEKVWFYLAGFGYTPTWRRARKRLFLPRFNDWRWSPKTKLLEKAFKSWFGRKQSL